MFGKLKSKCSHNWQTNTLSSREVQNQLFYITYAPQEGGQDSNPGRDRRKLLKKNRVSSSTTRSATSVNIHGPPDEIIKPNKRTFTAQWSPASLAEANNEMYHKIVPTTYRGRVVSNMNFI